MPNKLRTENREYPYINTITLLMFCGYVITWYLQLGYRKPLLGEIRFEFIYAACLTVVALFFWRKEDWTCPLLKYVLLYIFVIIIQVLFSYDFKTSWDVFINRVVKFSFMAFFIISFLKGPRDLKYFLAAFLLACFKMGQEGLWGKLTGAMMWQSQGVTRLHWSTPLYQHPNSFSGMANGTLPFIYYLIPLVNKYFKVLLFVLLTFSLNIIIYTGSRTGYIGFLIFIIFIFLKAKNKKKFLLYTILLGVLAIPFVPEQYIERFDSIFTGIDKEGNSIGARKQILEDAIDIFIQHPFGVGVSAFPAIRMERFGRTQDTHNLYLEIATNLGIQGLIVFFVLISAVLKMLFYLEKSFKKQETKIIKFKENGEKNYIEKHSVDLRLMSALCRAIYLFLIVRLGLGLFGMDLYEIYWWFAIGLTIALYNIEKTMLIITDKFIEREQSA